MVHIWSRYLLELRGDETFVAHRVVKGENLAGTVKREALNAPEMLLMMRTLRDMNLSKLIAEDVSPPPQTP